MTETTQTPETSEPLVVVDVDLLTPPDRRFWLDPETIPDTPTFKVKEVAQIFFGKSVDWLRWRMRPDDKRVTDPRTGKTKVIPGEHPEGFFVLDGVPLEFGRTASNSRYFTLADIERMVHALLQQGSIDGRTANLSMRMVVTCARLHGITV